MSLNEFVYPVQFTKMMGEMWQPLSAKLSNHPVSQYHNKTMMNLSQLVKRWRNHAVRFLTVNLID